MKVSQIAKAIGYSPEELLLQIKAAGLTHKNAEEEINNEDKKILLNFIKSSKKASKKTISLKKTTNKASTNSKVSITRLNQNKDATSSEISKDFSGTIDFDDAERKRVSAEKSKEAIKDQSVEEKNKGNVVRRIKKSETSLKQNKPVNLKKTNSILDDSKKNKRELEGEKYLETKLSANV